MKRTILLFVCILPLLSLAQFRTEEAIILKEDQDDDVYLVGERIVIDSNVDGDVIIAGNSILVKDSIREDFIAAGGEIVVNGYVKDDIRIAGGKLTIDNEIGDDLIAAGGEIYITDDALIRGNFVAFAGNIIIDGEIMGEAKIHADNIQVNGKIIKKITFYSNEIFINGEIHGTSEIVAETIVVGDDAKFYGDVIYWSEDGEVDFKKSLHNASAVFSMNLAPKDKELAWSIFSLLAIGFWIFYILSAFLVIVLFNFMFKKAFSSAVGYIDDQVLKSLGYGMMYLIGVPILIVLSFIILIGIPLGLVLTSFYVFSILFGHLIVALLLTYYVDEKNDASWNFWTIVSLALAIAVVIRILTFIPIFGGIFSIISIAIGYGLLILTILQKKPFKKQLFEIQK